jgi:hypothetical protein
MELSEDCDQFACARELKREDLNYSLTDGVRLNLEMHFLLGKLRQAW